MLRHGHAFVLALVVLAANAGLAPGAPQAPPSGPIALGSRERELLIVRHVREHLAVPDDGVALAADRNDLRAAAIAAARAREAGSLDPWDDLAVIAETWHRRVNERASFALMGRAQFELVAEARRALAQSLGTLPPADRERLAPAFEEELTLLQAQLSGSGALPDSFIDRALAAADAGAAGRPAPYAGTSPGPGPGPYYVPRRPMPYPAPPGPRPESPNPYGEYASPASDNPANPAGAAGAAYGGTSAGGHCQASRVVAGDTFTADAFLRNAECWSRQKVWPGWAAQVVEALTWAVDAAVYQRDCQGLDAVARQMGSLAAGPTPFPEDRVQLVGLRRRLEAERAWLRGTACR